MIDGEVLKEIKEELFYKHRKSVQLLDTFTESWCTNESAEDDLKFMCKECPFNVDGGICLVKVFKENFYSTYKDFDSMGDL